MMAGTLTNRSTRKLRDGRVSAPNSANGSLSKLVTKTVPLRRPHDGSSNNYRNTYDADGDDSQAVKSNTGLPSTTARYVLPCFRLRSKKSAVMALLASAAILLSICSALVAYYYVDSMSPSAGHYFLPPPREWGAGRARRKQARWGRRRRANSSPNAGFPKVKAVSYTEYEMSLLN